MDNWRRLFASEMLPKHPNKHTSLSLQWYVLFKVIERKDWVDTHLSVSAFKDDSKCAMSDQVFPTELKFPYRLHIVVKSGFILLWAGQMTRRPQVVLFVIECYFLLCKVVAAAGMFNPSFTCHGLPSWRQTVPFSHVRTHRFWSSTPNAAVRRFPSLTVRPTRS